jgi:hypothetical protein
VCDGRREGAKPPLRETSSLTRPSEIEFGLAQASASKRETGRPRDGFSAKMARSAAEKRSRSERIPTEAEGVCDGRREGAKPPLREASSYSNSPYAATHSCRNFFRA